MNAKTISISSRHLAAARVRRAGCFMASGLILFASGCSERTQDAGPPSIPDESTPSKVTETFYEGGTIQSRSHVLNGVLNGLSEGWYTNGILQVAEHFEQGNSVRRRLVQPYGIKVSSSSGSSE